jgi:Heterokaryon incompatibility protein (HET)
MWIDAICIDQNNNKERTAQVKLMRDPKEENGRRFFFFFK